MVLGDDAAEEILSLRTQNRRGISVRETMVLGDDAAEEILSLRTQNLQRNRSHIKRIFDKYAPLFDQLLDRAPNIEILIANVLIFRVGWRVLDVDWRVDVRDWSEEDARRVGYSFSGFMQATRTGNELLDAWRLHYPALNVLFDEVEGFDHKPLFSATRH